MKLLITTRCDERVKDLSDISHPIIKKYALDCGADFMILDHEPESDSGDGRPHYRIMKHYELHQIALIYLNMFHTKRLERSMKIRDPAKKSDLELFWAH